MHIINKAREEEMLTTPQLMGQKKITGEVLRPTNLAGTVNMCQQDSNNDSSANNVKMSNMPYIILVSTFYFVIKHARIYRLEKLLLIDL